MIRGAIEGFYGPPWSHAEWLQLLRFCAGEGLTTWVALAQPEPFG